MLLLLFYFFKLCFKPIFSLGPSIKKLLLLHFYPGCVKREQISTAKEGDRDWGAMTVGTACFISSWPPLPSGIMREDLPDNPSISDALGKKIGTEGRRPTTTGLFSSGWDQPENRTEQNPRRRASEPVHPWQKICHPKLVLYSGVLTFPTDFFIFLSHVSLPPWVPAC